MSDLFPLADPRPAEAAPRGVARVAIEQSVDKLLDYAVPSALAPQLRVGQRVRVPLGRGNRAARGYVVALADRSEHATLKPVAAIEDARPLVGGALLDLALWIGRYYCCPLGTVLQSVIPSAVARRIGMEYVTMVTPAAEPARLQSALESTRLPKRRALLGRLLQLQPGEAVELQRLAGEAGVAVATVRKLVAAGLARLEMKPDLDGLAAPPEPGEVEPELELNEDQRAAVQRIQPTVEHAAFGVFLLHGVTGSGKTEVYLRLIRAAVDQGRQAIVLVPEIALTPQTVRRFVRRFGRVAILHSGLTASQRHRSWQQIASGQADVVVGARSAVFAPLPKPGLIVVDEEHESSYKQDTAPRYHARDVAIKRGQIEGVPVVLGSATPSLESWRRAQAPRGEAAPYGVVTLPRRVRGLALPTVELVDLRLESRLRPGVHLLSKRLETLLETTLAAGEQAILLLNRRGYANFIHCPSCQHLVTCRYCDATMTYHRSAGAAAPGGTAAGAAHAGQLHCHYCLAVSPLPEKCPDCGRKLSLFGLGTQRVEEELKRKFPALDYARVDSDTMRSGRDYERTLARFGRGEIRLMLGTQMIAKGLDYPNVTLVGVISGDTALSLPDFRAGERTFQLITQVAGRAGRGDRPGRVVLQTFVPDDPTIQSALRQDFADFAARELTNRSAVGLPPVTRMVRIILRDRAEAKLNERSEALAGALGEAARRHGAEVRLKGPMPCPIARIAGFLRSQILLAGASAARLQDVLARVREQGHLAQSDRVAVDVDPVSLL